VDRDINQRGANAAPPQIRLDEQSIELSDVIVYQDRGKSGEAIPQLRDKQLTPLDLLYWQLDRVRLGFQLLPIFDKGKAGPALQRLQRVALFGHGDPNDEFNVS
jgi:hypothetical protein